MSVLEAHQRALLIEQSTRNQAASWNSSCTRVSSSTETWLSKTLDQLSISDNSEGTAITSQQRTSNFKCFKCGEHGHRQSNCPNLNRRCLLASDEPVYDTYEEEDIAAEEDINTCWVIQVPY